MMTVVVAGGARGRGRAVARALHRNGARVVLCDRSPRALIEAAKAIGEIICLPADLPADTGRVLRRAGRVKMLVIVRGKRAAAAIARAARPHLARSGGAVVGAAAAIRALRGGV